MTKQDVMDYVMTTPGNPNKAVLSGMLDSIAEAGGDVTPLFVHLTYDVNGQFVQADTEELNDLQTALANHDKPLWVQLKDRNTHEGETFENIMWVAPATYSILFGDFAISASCICGDSMEVIDITWDGSSISGGYSTYQLQLAQ